MNKNNIVRAAGVLSLVASLLLGPLTPLAQAAAGPWPSVNGLSAPTVLLVNEMGSWTVKASESDNSPLSYAADWGDASAAQPASTNPTLTHAYSAPGTYTVNLTVENGGGFTSHESATVLVENPQGAPLVISNVAATSTGPTSEQITWSTNTRANSSLWLSTSTPVDISGAPSIIRSARVFHHSLTLKDLLPGTTYFAVAGSRDFNRNTATSSEISFSTPSAISPLTAPTDLSSTSTTESSTVLSWTASTGGVTPITYAVMQDGVVVGTTTDTTFTDTGLSPSTTYSYVIEATDSATPTPGVADSSALSVTTLSASAPTIASVSGPSSLAAGIEGTWTLNASDPVSANLTYSVDWGDTPAAAAIRPLAAIVQTSTFSHTYAAAGTYNIVFTVTNDAGLSATATTSVTVTPATSPLTVPTNVIATSSEDSVTLSWDASTGGVAPITYSVMQDGVVVGTTTDTTFTDTGLSPSTTYNYVIEATDSATPTPGVADSSAVTATTLPASAPTIASVDGPSSLVAGAEGTWTLGASDPENGTLTYSVDWGDTPAGALLRRAAMVIQTSTFSHTYAAAGTYNIVFTATNEAGLSTTATTSVTVTPATSPLTAPTDLSSTSTTESSTILSWTASTGGVTPITYAVMRDGTAIGTTTDTTFTDTGLSPSTTYSYVIEATDSATPTPGVADSSALSVTTPAAAAQTFTLAEIAAHNTASDCWTAINGSVYNLTSFIDSHPGGVANITSICGIDGATLFNAIHGNDSTAQAALVPLKIGILAA